MALDGGIGIGVEAGGPPCTLAVVDDVDGPRRRRLGVVTQGDGVADEHGIDFVETAVQAQRAVFHDAAFGLEEEEVIEVCGGVGVTHVVAGEGPLVEGGTGVEATMGRLVVLALDPAPQAAVERFEARSRLVVEAAAQRAQRGVGLEPGAHRAHLGDAPGEVLGEQPDDDGQNVMDQTHPALDPAHRARELDRIAAQRIGRRAQARGLLGVRHHRFEGIEGARKPSGQTVGQQAEGGVTFGAVPASDACSARGLARVGPVACQRTSPVGVIRAALKPCIAPRLGNNVLLAGKPSYGRKWCTDKLSCAACLC